MRVYGLAKTKESILVIFIFLFGAATAFFGTHWLEVCWISWGGYIAAIADCVAVPWQDKRRTRGDCVIGAVANEGGHEKGSGCGGRKATIADWVSWQDMRRSRRATKEIVLPKV